MSPMNGDPTGAGWPDEINLEDEAVLEMARRTNPDSNPRPNPIPLEPKVPIAPEKKKKTFKDEQLEEIAKLPPELQPYGAELIEWIGSHENPTPVYNTLVSFLQYRNTKFKIIPGNGFYFSPADGIISVSTPFYKEMKEKVGMEMTPMQFIFGAMHEFAHLKAMIELNDAGLQNMLRQFDYVQNKKFAKPGEDGKPAFYSAGGIYAFYYNILEDVIVNTMVENTELYGANFTEGKKNRQEVTDLYTEKFFAIHLPAGAGQGDYTLNGEEFVKIEQGQGDYKRAAKEDYDRGFDWTKLPVPMRRASQFTTYLMKNQMIGLSEKSVFDPEKQPDGKHILDPDVAMIFTRPLVEVYKTLLQKVAEKYKNDPEKYLSYLKFMTTFQKIQTWGEKNGEVVETESHKVLNVMSETCVTDLKINFDRAALNYEYGPLSNMINQYGLEGDITSLTFLQVFNQFKELNFRAPASGTIPFKYNLLKRTQVIRETLEPIFSLLLILDDSFKAKEAGDPPPTPPEPPKWPPETEWQEGDEVKSKKTSRTGRIVTVNKDSGSGVSSVVVVWDKRSDGSSKNKNTGSLDMASGIDEGLFSGEIETIFDPDKNLILLVNKPKKGKKPPKGPIPKKKDPRDKEYKDDDDDEDEDDDDEEDDDEDEDEDGGDGVPSDEKDDKKPKDGDDESEDKEGSEDKNDDEGDSEDEDDSEDEGKEGEDDVEGEGDEEEPDSIKELRGYKKFLKKLQRQRAREKRLKKIEDELNGNKFRKNRRDLAEEERLLGILKSKAGEFGKGGVRVPEVTREAIREVMKLEDILRDDIEKMAQSWKEVVNNISSKIETFRDRFYRVGRMEPKRMQRYFLQILEGQDVNDRMIHSLIKERIITELKPKALRIVLLIDNSGSMSDSGKVDSIKKSVLLLNSSLRSFRAIFKLMMEDVYSEYGMTLPENIDIVTDIQIRLFGEEASMVKPFEVNDYSFLTEPEGTVALPQIDPDRETIATVIAFQNIRPNGGTDDTSSYEEIVGNDLNEKIVGHILKGEISEAIIQISDGGVNMAGHSMAKNKAGERSRTIYSGATGENLSTNGDRRTIQLIKFLREKYKVGTAGFAIGAGGEAETAYKALVERMGSSDYVTSANNISEIVQGFSAIIRNVIVQQVQNKMIDELEGYAQRIEAEIKQTPED